MESQNYDEWAAKVPVIMAEIDTARAAGKTDEQLLEECTSQERAELIIMGWPKDMKPADWPEPPPEPCVTVWLNIAGADRIAIHQRFKAAMEAFVEAEPDTTTCYVGDGVGDDTEMNYSCRLLPATYRRRELQLMISDATYRLREL